MSTGYVNSQSRFLALARLGEVVFHTNDLANLWHITNKNTLHTTLKRYVEQRLLFRIYKGFYSIKPISEVDPFLLGLKAIHGYAYVSCETILTQEGIIQQAIPAITFVSTQTKRFAIGERRYYVRKLADSFLYQSIGILSKENGVRKATRERAVVDLLYFNRHAYFDGASLIDWKKVQSMQEKLGYPLTPQRYG